VIYNLLARLLARPAVANYLIRRAKKTPYTNILSPDRKEVYMVRLWLFNPYKYVDGKEVKKYPNLPSIRLHKIMVPDRDRDQHDHPWNARTFILRGWYWERRSFHNMFLRKAGQTATIKFEEYHNITQVSPGGVWTMFVTGKLKGMWGFKVDGVKVPFWEYLKARK
jgi:hypothetical protein